MLHTGFYTKNKIKYQTLFLLSWPQQWNATTVHDRYPVPSCSIQRNNIDPFKSFHVFITTKTEGIFGVFILFEFSVIVENNEYLFGSRLDGNKSTTFRPPSHDSPLFGWHLHPFPLKYITK